MSSKTLNLLPQEAVRAYVRSRRVTIISRLLFGIAVLFALFAVFAGVAWQYLAIIHKAEEKQEAIAQKSAELAVATEFEGKLQDLTKGLKVLRKLSEPQYDPSALLRDVVAALPVNATLQMITVNFQGKTATAVKSGSSSEGTSTSTKPGTQQSSKTSGAQNEGMQLVFLSGNAATRADVLALQHALESLSYVQSVDAPVTNILKPEDTTFSFALTLKPFSSLSKEAAAVSGTAAVP